MTKEVLQAIEKSVLCWLATADAEGMPNVSPKEVFCAHKGYLAIAQIASPGSVRNIRVNPLVSVSFIDVFVQKGYKLKGRASILQPEDGEYEPVARKLREIGGPGYPFRQVIQVEVTESEPIIAPSYRFFPETSEAGQVQTALKTYRVRDLLPPEEFSAPMAQEFMESARKLFRYYKSLGDGTFAQLKDADLFHKASEHENSIANIVYHLSGNMLSRWTDFLTTDGEKESRNRDREFEDVLLTRAALLAAWEEGWECVFTGLNQVTPANFHTVVYIRNQGHSVLEAVQRQLAHYASHVGQIVVLGKQARGGAWKSLSIPKGGSKAFNQKAFGKEKGRGHFTDDFLNKEKE